MKFLPLVEVPYKPVYIASIVCDKICRTVGVNPPLYPRRVEFFSKSRAFSIDKARNLLGYSPQFDLHKGLSLTGEWYKEQGYI